MRRKAAISAEERTQMMSTSLQEGLAQGIFQNKYKVFCRGLKQTSDFINPKPFSTDYLSETGFFLLVDVGENNHLHLSKYLNSGVIDKTNGAILEAVLVVAPNMATSDTSGYIPRYFSLSETGDLETIDETTIDTFRNI